MHISQTFVLLYVEHAQHAVLPTQIHSHLAGPRHDISPQQRCIMKDNVIAHTHNLITSKQELQDQLTIPNPNQPPFPEIPIYVNGLACTKDGCQFLCRQSKHMASHYQSVHHWLNPYRRGGSLRSRQNHQYPWREKVRCQRFFTQGSRQEYFEVRPVNPVNTLNPASGLASYPASEAIKQHVLDQITQKQAQIRASQQSVNTPDKLDANPWLNRTEWPRHLNGLDFESMASWVELPQQDEVVLQAMCQNLTQVTNTAQQLIMTLECGLFARLEINRKDEKKPRRPFQARMETQTKQRYQQVWHRIICIIYRTYQATVAPPYQLTDRQRQVFHRWVELAEQAPPEDGSSSDPSPHGSNSEDSDEESRTSDSPPPSLGLKPHPKLLLPH